MKIKTLIIALIVAINLQAQLTWSSAAEMNFSRNGHTMTGLQDGFLVTGGYDGFENLKSAELFIAGSTYDWVLVGDMDSIRFEHKATRYEHAGAEKVLISGGWNGGSINYYGTQIYDATSQSFSDGPDMSVGRSGHTSTQLNDGRILLVGGYSSAGGNTTIVEIFDPATETISQVASLQTGRSYHTATLLNDGRVLVAGGFNPDAGFQMNSCEIYDPMLDTWTTVASMTFTRDYHAAVALSGNRVLVSGGRFFNGTGFDGHTACEMYNVSTDSWSAAAFLPEGQSYHQMFNITTTSADIDCPGFDWVVLPGGTNESGFGIDLTFSPTYFYCVENDTWHERSMALDGRYAYAAAKSYWEDKLLVSGGFDGSAELLEIPLVDITESPGLVGNVVIFPQPVQDMLQVIWEDFTAREWVVIDLSCREVMHGNLLNGAQTAMSLNVNELQPGVYILHIIDGNNRSALSRFIKQ